MMRRARARYAALRQAAAAIIAEEQDKPPAPGPRSTPGAGPEPGEGLPAGPPSPNAGEPSPGHLLVSSRLYSDGVVIVYDHVRGSTRRFELGEAVGMDLSDEALKEWLTDDA